MKIVKNQCYNLDSNPRECAQLLHHLPYADILAVTMTKVIQLIVKVKIKEDSKEY